MLGSSKHRSFSEPPFVVLLMVKVRQPNGTFYDRSVFLVDDIGEPKEQFFKHKSQLDKSADDAEETAVPVEETASSALPTKESEDDKAGSIERPQVHKPQATFLQVREYVHLNIFSRTHTRDRR
jgi:hypothetical protein